MPDRIFCGATIHEAMARVKQRLGPDAMILDTRQSVSGNRRIHFEIEAVPAGTDIAYDRGIENAFGGLREPMRIDDLIAVFTRHTQGIMEELVSTPKALNLYARMIQSGIGERNARIFLEKSGAFDTPPAANGASLSRRTIDAIAAAIPVVDVFGAAGSSPVIAAAIGTTGVGKTTTIAKIAAQLMLKKQKKVGLISVDTYRIGAFEQLRVYAKILGIPCFQAFKRQDLTSALKRLAQCHAILIDTAGQSQYDRRRISELRELLTGEASIGCHLCLSVGADASEMDRTVRNFSPLTIDSFIFTKVDEAEKYGSMINQLIKTPHPVSYLTTGQNVPEDIERADRKRIVRMLFDKNQPQLRRTH